MYQYSIVNNLVAGAGFEPATSRLWASRAAIAPPRVAIIWYNLSGGKFFPLA